jgi:hypothetical protein
MCLALFEYYPRNRFLEQRCMSVINRPSLPYLLGAQATYGMGDPDYTWVLDAQGIAILAYGSARLKKFDPLIKLAEISKKENIKRDDRFK